MPLMSAPWVVHLLDPSVTVLRDDIGRVQHIRYDWTGEAVAAATDTSVVLLHRSWGLRTPLADTGRQLPTGEYAFYLRYVPLGGPYDVGSHPYLSTRGTSLDDVVLTVPVGETFDVDDQQIPLRRRPITDDEDFRTANRLEHQQPVAGVERVGCTRHRLERDTRLPGRDLVDGVDLHEPEGLVEPQRRAEPVTAQSGDGLCFGGRVDVLEADVGEALVEASTAEPVRRAEVLVVGNGATPHRDLLVVDVERLTDRNGQQDVVERRAPRRQVRVRAHAERCTGRPVVAAGQLDQQAVGVEGVAHLGVHLERVALLRHDVEAEPHAVVGLLDERPARPPSETVDGVALVGLGQPELLRRPVERVLPVADAVGPRDEGGATSLGRQLIVAVVAGDVDVLEGVTA